MLRALPYLAVALAVWWVVDLRADNAALRVQAALDRAEIEAERAAHQQLTFALAAEREAAVRHAETMERLNIELETYRNGTCDPNDPACAVDYINRLLAADGESDLP